MAKITWNIERKDCDLEFQVVANTRIDAIAKAEAQWMRDFGSEFSDLPQDDRPSMPEFSAKKAINNQKAIGENYAV